MSPNAAAKEDEVEREEAHAGVEPRVNALSCAGASRIDRSSPSRVFSFLANRATVKDSGEGPMRLEDLSVGRSETFLRAAAAGAAASRGTPPPDTIFIGGAAGGGGGGPLITGGGVAGLSARGMSDGLA